MRMCRDIASSMLLKAFRDEPPVNLTALGSLLRAVGEVSLEHSEIAEIDLNPVKPHGDRVVAVDALIVLSGKLGSR